MNPFDEIQQAYDRRQPLPGLAYRDPQILAAEAETVLRDGWASVACGQNVAKPGDLFPIRIGGQSLLVVRDRQEEIRVFYNLCRHRGAPLATASCHARGDRIICPYHAWTYDLDGALAAAPHFQRADTDPPLDSEREGLGLLPVRCAIWRDIVFVNLSGAATPFEEFIRPLDERLAPWTAAELQPLCSDEYEIQVNWKLAAENFLDAYHLPIVHPEIGGGFAGILDAQDVEISEDIVGVVLPGGYGEGSGQTESRLPRFSGLGGDQAVRIEVFGVFPNTLILVEPDNQQVIVLRPQTPELTHETFANYVVSGATQTQDLAGEREEVRRSARQINDQDAALLADLQSTRSMDLASNTRLTRSWDRTNERFQQIWSRKLLAGVGNLRAVQGTNPRKR